jgi:small-conductance mechanosensitive channel
MDLLIIGQWSLPLAFAILGLIAGFFFKKIILPGLRKCCTLTRHSDIEVIADASSPYITLWSTIIGFYMAVQYAPLKPPIGNILVEALFVITAVSVILFTAKSTADLFGLYLQKRPENFPRTSMYKNLIYIFVGIVGTLFIFQSLGLSITPLLAAMGVGGIAVALAIQNPLSNFFSGLHIIASTQIQPGDYIKLDTGDEGLVMDISWHSTVLRAPTDYVILIPNAKLASAIVTNYHLKIREMIFSVNGMVSYKTNLEKAQKVALEVAKQAIESVPGSVREFEPVFLFTGLSDRGINFSVLFKAADFGKQAELRHEFIKKLYLRFETEGISLPYPITSVDIKEPRQIWEEQRRDDAPMSP